MSLFTVIKYSPLTPSVDLFDRLPLNILEPWMIITYDGHMVTFDWKDTDDKIFRTNMIRSIIRERDKHIQEWWIESLKAKDSMKAAEIILQEMLLSIEDE